MATLPDRFKLKTLNHLEVGEHCYIRPWDMIVDMQEECFLRMDSQISYEKVYNYRLKVSKSEKGYTVHAMEILEDLQYKWKPGDHSSININNPSLFSPVHEIV